MSKKITVLIDGGHLRNYLKRAKKTIDADYIEKVGLSCPLTTEEIIRILYYDCALFNGQTKLPVSRTVQTFNQTTPYLHDLARKDLFAVRRGVLKFRGYVIKRGHQPSNRQSIPTSRRSSNRRAWTCGSASIWQQSQRTVRWI